MRMAQPWREMTAVVLVFAFLCVFLPTSPAMAGWAPTRSTIQGPKARLVSVIEREEISRSLQEMGIDPAEAKRRVAGLTDAEAQMALERIDSLPAGGNLLLGLVGFAVVVFIVLLITDILGFTDVFPFVKRTVR